MQETDNASFTSHPSLSSIVNSEEQVQKDVQRTLSMSSENHSDAFFSADEDLNSRSSSLRNSVLSPKEPREREENVAVKMYLLFRFVAFRCVVFVIKRFLADRRNSPASRAFWWIVLGIKEQLRIPSRKTAGFGCPRTEAITKYTLRNIEVSAATIEYAFALLSYINFLESNFLDLTILLLNFSGDRATFYSGRFGYASPTSPKYQ